MAFTVKQNEMAAEIESVINERQLSKIDYIKKVGKLFLEARRAFNSDTHFGEWVQSLNLVDPLPTQTHAQYRTIARHFDNVANDVIYRIGLSNCYKLDGDELKKLRNKVIKAATEKGTKYTGATMADLIAEAKGKTTTKDEKADAGTPVEDVEPTTTPDTKPADVGGQAIVATKKPATQPVAISVPQDLFTQVIDVLKADKEHQALIDQLRQLLDLPETAPQGGE